MSLILKSSRVLQRIAAINPAASFASHAPAIPVRPEEIIGKREIVGFGLNGDPSYIDRADFPMPAIRFKAPSSDIQSLREKEKGDWKKLSKEEKKALYRASFCQTFAEMNAPTGEWKSIVGCTLGLISVGVWIFLFLKMFVYPKELPVTFQLERQQAQLKRMIDIGVDPIEGLSSKWDYEKGDWKK